MKTDSKPLGFMSLTGISDKTMAIHHDKLYAGYVAKKNKITDWLAPLMTGKDVSGANQVYSELRALKDAETFATNGVYLHEWYFDVLGGNGAPEGALVDALKRQYGTLENFITYFSACGMAARGWVVLCWDTKEKELRVYTGDSHNQGGVWGCLPILVLDVYEHAYFIDAGSDRKAYIGEFWKNVNWKKVDEFYSAAMK